MLTTKGKGDSGETDLLPILLVIVNSRLYDFVNTRRFIH